MEMKYTPANARAIFDEWHGCKEPGFTPKERHLPIIQAIKEALASGLKYTDDVAKFAGDRLGVPAEIRKLNAEKVENGDFGMDCYYARCYLETQERIERERLALQELAPAIGMQLGTLVFSDFKRTTGVTVIGFDDEAKTKIRLSGKRGSAMYEMTAGAVQINNAITRAFERGNRKDDFAAFVRAQSAASNQQAA